MDVVRNQEQAINNNEITIDDIEDKIEVRNEPHIYAFSTNTIPNYIKVGDTFRPIEKRLDEWREKYNGLERLFPSTTNEDEGLAVVNKDIYFRDYSLHYYFEKLYKNCRIKDDNEIFIKDNTIYFSNEFFKDINIDTIKDGIRDIKEDYNNEVREYDFYKLSDKKPDETHWKNDQKWNLRKNQEEVVNNFCEKVDSQKELLMYAVMRFGKSFTSLMCAKSKDYKKVLVVSAKADVVGEWKQTVEKPEHFKEYAFLTDKDFVRYYERNKDIDLIDEIINNRITDDEYLKGKNKVVVFLTLQNLSGKAEDGKNIKEKLKKIYNTKFDLVIVDETHYGAWAKSYGSPLNNKEEDEDTVKKELKEYDKFIDTTNAKIITEHKLHLSGTPYNLLYDEKFADKNIIATCQFSDILRDKEKWIEENNKKPEAEQKEEWENPYFGFPKMLRFAFNIPESTRKKLIELKKDGKWSLNDLLETNKDDNNTKFIHEEEVLQLLKAIDGSAQEKGILGFLNIPKIKDNNVCKHIVMVLPYKYSCDAMEILLQNNKDKFINLVNDNVEILNITGHNVKPSLVDIDNVKKTITDCENQGKKTITLTVNKMLTGVTVPEWDTMIMLKNSKSPQEYDQAIFRIQNQYVKEYIEEKNEKTEESDSKSEDKKIVKKEIKIIKKDMKPQTILVDFDPMRMFELLGLSTRIVNKIKNDELSLEEALEVETKCFNIIAYNADKLIEVQPNNLIEIITNYNNKKSLMESVAKIKLNLKLLDNKYIEEFIKNQSKADISNKLTTEAHSGEKRDIDINIDEDSENIDLDIQQNDNTSSSDNSNKSNAELQKRYRMCILGLSFYAFLSNSNICGLKDILKSINDESVEKERNNRIFKNLNLDQKFIKQHLENNTRSSSFEIDEFIKRANMLSKDKKLSAEKRAKNALNNFSKISDSEIVTPNERCENMLDCIGEYNLIETINNDGRILDIASKTGEFAYAIYSKLKDKVDIEKLKKSIYAIPTSSTTYEFTRKIFESLDLPIENIAENFNSYDLIDIKLVNKQGKKTKKIDSKKICDLISQNKPFNKIDLKEEIKKGEEKVKFDIIIGNPPYQQTLKEATKGNNKNTTDIYQFFQKIALNLADRTCMIYPAKDFQRGKLNTLDKKLRYLRIYNGSNRNGEKHIPYEDSVFGDSVRRIPGDVGVYYYDKNNSNNKIIYQELEIDRTNKILPIIKEFLGISKKLQNFSNSFVFSNIRKVCESNFVEHNKNSVINCNDRNAEVPKGYTKVITNDKEGSGGTAKWYYIKTSDLDRQPVNNKYKIIIASARPNESFSNVNSIEIIDKNESFGRTKECIYDTEDYDKAVVCKKYFSTKFAQSINLMTPDKFLYYLPNFDDVYEDIKSKSIAKIDKEANEKYECNTINEVDAKLYEKYGLEKEEVQFIEKMIKPME